MSEQYIYTALIDVLAYRSRLERDMRLGTSSMRDDLEGALSVFDKVNNAIFGVQAISDTIILTCNNHANFECFLNIIKEVFLSFLRRGIFIRGGLAYSKHFQSGRLTYSHAISRAYKIESSAAIYPRIVVDRNIVDMYKIGSGLPNILGKDHFNERNGVAFVNVILNQDSWKKAYQDARALYDRDREAMDSDERAFAKHVWFEDYLFSSPYMIQEANRYIEPIKSL